MTKHSHLAAALAAVLFAPIALAQAPTSTRGSLLDALLTPGSINAALVIVASAVGLFAGGSWLSTTRKRRIALAAYHAFRVVEDIAAEDLEDNALDKAARGLQVVDKWMRVNKWRPLKPGEQELVRLEFQSMHGALKILSAAQGTTTGAGAARAPAAGAIPLTPGG